MSRMGAASFSVVHPHGKGVGYRRFRAEGCCVSMLGLNGTAIGKYIEDQGKHDIALDKLSVREYEDSFRGSR